MKQENKLGLIKIGALDSACRLISHGHEDIVVYGGITLMKSLILVGVDAVAVVVKRLSLSSKLVELSNASVKKRESHVLYEAARSICSLALQADEELRKVIAETKDLSVPLELLLSSKFGILHSEACRALSLFYGVAPQRVLDIIGNSKDIMVSLVAILGRDEDPKPDDFVATNANDIPVISIALQLLATLAKGGEASVNVLKNIEGLSTALQALIDANKSPTWTELAIAAQAALVSG